MIIDISALIAILRSESETEICAKAIAGADIRRVSAVLRGLHHFLNAASGASASLSPTGAFERMAGSAY
jgi:uncharacterized protein with PIN domain